MIKDSLINSEMKGYFPFVIECDGLSIVPEGLLIRTEERETLDNIITEKVILLK